MTVSSGVLMREAASALHASLRVDDRPWEVLSWDEQGWWGCKAAPTILATLAVTKPEHWEHHTREIIAMLSMWGRSGAAAHPNPITTHIP